MCFLTKSQETHGKKTLDILKIFKNTFSDGILVVLVKFTTRIRVFILEHFSKSAFPKMLQIFDQDTYGE